MILCCLLVAHFLVVAKANNKIVLRNGEHADCHLATVDGLPCKSVRQTLGFVSYF